MDTFSTVKASVEAIKAGKMIILVDDIDRENEGDFVCSAELITNELVNQMITDGRGLVCVPISEQKAKQLSLTPMVINNTDTYRTAFTISIDANECTTGISTMERTLTIQKIASPLSTHADFKKPGHMFPLIGKNGGVIERPGHTEASLALMELAGLGPTAVICEILNADGSMARRKDLLTYAKTKGLEIIEIVQLIQYIKEQ
jgi:3,4-dihydroxy 2-butanone 4-phosphate synthase/GTP cyclohydrolase II